MKENTLEGMGAAAPDSRLEEARTIFLLTREQLDLLPPDTQLTAVTGEVVRKSDLSEATLKEDEIEAAARDGYMPYGFLEGQQPAGMVQDKKSRQPVGGSLEQRRALWDRWSSEKE